MWNQSRFFKKISEFDVTNVFQEKIQLRKNWKKSSQKLVRISSFQISYFGKELISWTSNECKLSIEQRSWELLQTKIRKWETLSRFYERASYLTVKTGTWQRKQWKDSRSWIETNFRKPWWCSHYSGIHFNSENLTMFKEVNALMREVKVDTDGGVDYGQFVNMLVNNYPVGDKLKVMKVE